MGTVKIKLHTWQRCGNRDTKFKRGIAAREAYVEYDAINKKVTLKEGSKKWKPWDTTIARGKDQGYINDRKELYSGLCFNTKKEAQAFMEKHKNELDILAKSNPLFDHWTMFSVSHKFEPTSKKVYGKDIKED